MPKIKEYSPNFKRYTESEKIWVSDNAVEITNLGNTEVWLDDYLLEPNGGFLRTPFTKPSHVAKFDFYMKIGDKNVVDTGEVKKLVSIVRTNFHKIS